LDGVAIGIRPVDPRMRDRNRGLVQLLPDEEDAGLGLDLEPRRLRDRLADSLPVAERRAHAVDHLLLVEVARDAGPRVLRAEEAGMEGADAIAGDGGQLLGRQRAAGWMGRREEQRVQLARENAARVVVPMEQAVRGASLGQREASLVERGIAD